MTRDAGRSSGRASGAGTPPVGDASGGQDHDDPELDEILAAFQRRPRASGAVVALSELVGEPAPLPSEPSGREGETFLLPRTRDRQRRLRVRKAAAVAAIVTVAAVAALWFALRSRAHLVSVPSAGTPAAESGRPPIAGGAAEAPPSPATPAASASGSAGRPAAKAPRVPKSPPPGPNLDPELKRSM
jgi:hypothetical protein